MLRWQLTAGNRAVTTVVQRLTERREGEEATTDRARRAGGHGFDVNLAAVYVAERETDGSFTAPHVLGNEHASTSGGTDADQHAERNALRAAGAAGYQWSRREQLTGTPIGRVVRVHTELFPCERCFHWLDYYLSRDITVTWTAPYDKQDAAAWSWRVPNRLFKFRISVSERLRALSDAAVNLRDPDLTARVDRVWRELVTMDYSPITWSGWFAAFGRDASVREQRATTYAQEVEQVWRDNVEGLEAEVRTRRRSTAAVPPASFTPTPAPPTAATTVATRILGPTHPSRPGTPGAVAPNRKQWPVRRGK
ncbi:hypothetical protein IOD16_14900 [Saccharothrix sp. 6-C]|uniref:hypothetical protein n=1 Tax=Saccharothrix sp. 6-C TaxID=2781735 RepID=UPI001916FB78|nr:hypothetical protein [Saccharothrix sp. 6-C]QQQ79568.1 hypothetical protein IOD16_14900 [Saccharothrix sp. 6-C]